MFEILTFTLGPVSTNAYLVADPETKEAAVIDPAWNGHIILKAAQERGWRIGHLPDHYYANNWAWLGLALYAGCVTPGTSNQAK